MPLTRQKGELERPPLDVPHSAMGEQQIGQRNDTTPVGGTEGVAAAPIGVFDSGVGGLTILSELLRELPGERYIYFGDTGNCPYGVRPQPEIAELAVNAVRLLLSHRAKLIVVACNAASVSALYTLRARFPQIQFVGVVPAVKPAAARSRTGNVGVAATEASARSDFLHQLIRQHASGVEVLAVGCPRLVTLAEAGCLEGPEVEAVIRDYIQPMLDAGIDTLVLGCTHFPAMRTAFQRVCGSQVAVIDSGEAVARRTRYLLTELQLLEEPPQGAGAAPRPVEAADRFWCSGKASHFAQVAGMILGQPVHAETVPGMLLETRECLKA